MAHHLGSYRYQAILTELRGLDKQSALLGRVIGGGESDGFRDPQPASIKKMVKRVARAQPVNRQRVGSVGRLVSQAIKTATELLDGEDVRAVRIAVGDG